MLPIMPCQIVITVVTAASYYQSIYNGQLYNGQRNWPWIYFDITPLVSLWRLLIIIIIVITWYWEAGFAQFSSPSHRSVHWLTRLRPLSQQEIRLTVSMQLKCRYWRHQLWALGNVYKRVTWQSARIRPHSWANSWKGLAVTAIRAAAC